MHNRKIRQKKNEHSQNRYIQNIHGKIVHRKIEDKNRLSAEKTEKYNIIEKIKAGTADIDRLWEKIYLTILALYVGFNTLFTTTLKIAWPPYFTTNVLPA